MLFSYLTDRWHMCIRDFTPWKKSAAHSLEWSDTASWRVCELPKVITWHTTNLWFFVVATAQQTCVSLQPRWHHSRNWWWRFPTVESCRNPALQHQTMMTFHQCWATRTVSGQYKNHETSATSLHKFAFAVTGPMQSNFSSYYSRQIVQLIYISRLCYDVSVHLSDRSALAYYS